MRGKYPGTKGCKKKLFEETGLPAQKEVIAIVQKLLQTTDLESQKICLRNSMPEPGRKTIEKIYNEPETLTEFDAEDSQG